MSPKTTVLLALLAGFAGGIVSQRIVPTPVYAQSPAPFATEIRAQTFVVVEQNGAPRGAFGMDKKVDGVSIEATDPKGHLGWVRWGGPLWGKGKSTVVPTQ